MSIVPQPRWGDLSAWGIWLIVVVVMIVSPWRPMAVPGSSGAALAPEGVLELWQSPHALFPWFSRSLRYRWRVAWLQAQQWQRAVQAWLLLTGRLLACRTLAEVIQVLTRRCVARYLGALPVLWVLLERLRVRDIINRYCPTQGEVDHGGVSVVMILNRLIGPRPLYQVMDWLASTVLSDYLGVPAAKFNDDRLGRTLDALASHAQAIWQDIVSQALLRYRIDLSVLFYDLTALVMTGDYSESELVSYGFAHNTPPDKQKVKVGLVVSADGGLPCLFQAWSGRTADKATVEKNMAALQALLKTQRCNTQQVLIVGDCANLSSELALAYVEHHLKYLAGVPLLEKAHRTLVLTPTERELYRSALTDEHGPQGYWGWPCEVVFKHAGRSVVHRGLVVLSGPMRTALRRTRAQQFWALFAALRGVQAKLGQKRHRTPLQVQRRAETQLRRSPVGKLVQVEASQTSEGGLTLGWSINRQALADAMRADGRYLLATNDFSLTPALMLARYRDKDAVEKRFRVFKQHVRVRPLFVHSDERLRALLLINLIALLAYSLLERQAQQQGVPMTTRRLLDYLSNLQVVELEAWDGSRTQTLANLTLEQQQLITVLLQGLELILPAGLPGPGIALLPPPRGAPIGAIIEQPLAPLAV